MGLLSFGGNSKKQQNWNDKQVDSDNNNFSMADPNLRKMAEGDPSTVTTLKPVAKLTRTAVDLQKKRADDMKEQEQLHGEFEASTTSIYKSTRKISQTQFSHGKIRISEGLKARETATQFGEFVNAEARPEFASQNYRYMLSREAGQRTIQQLGAEFNRAVDDLDSYQSEM